MKSKLGAHSNSLLSKLTKLVPDERGQILVMFTIMIPVMLGLTGLALEGGRLFMLHSQMQDLADAAALAGAKELDGANDAITRATGRAENLLTNDTWWSSIASAGIQILDPPTFYSALAGDKDPVTGRVQATDVVTTDPTQANYIKVVTVTRDVVPLFLVSVGATTGGVQATATAGTEYVICNVQPLMLCNPYGSDFKNNVHVGDLFGFTAQGQSSYSSGDFNLIDPAGQTHSGAQDIAALLSQSSANFCFADNVSPHTGSASGPVSNGINVRFDITPNPAGGLDTTPGPNVIKGKQSGGSCSNPQLTNDSDTTAGRPHALPLKINMSTTTPTGNPGSTFMGGTFDTTRANQYWRDHHNATGSWPSDPTSGNPLSRYQVYQNERNGVAGYTFIIGEDPAPSCNPPAGTDDRRKISVAIVNCNPPLAGNSINSLRSNAYANFFLVRPVDAGSNNTADCENGTCNPPGNRYPAGVIWTEFIEMLTPNTAGNKLHQIVQLYRDQ
jgi:Flp pilus assembly protein TadG